VAVDSCSTVGGSVERKKRNKLSLVKIK